MAFVAQLHRKNGCALAAIASVADLDYEAAYQKVANKKFNPNNGLYLEDMKKSLKRLGKPVKASVYVPKYRRHHRWIDNFLYRKKSSAILCADNGNDLPGTFHCLVWDKDLRRFWDPFEEGSFYFHDYYRIYRILLV